MNIGKTIKKIRTERGIGQRELATLLGLRPASLWKIENGKCYPKPSTIDEFCKKMGVPIARLYIESLEPSDY